MADSTNKYEKVKQKMKMHCNFGVYQIDRRSSRI